MLDSGGLQNVTVEGIAGQLSDHYDPRDNTMRLSEPVGNSNSVAAVAVAAHETGHAFQHARGEAGFKLRGSLVPAAGFASQAWFPIFLFGIITQASGLALVGVALFAAIVLFQLVTLPVEFGASRKAMAMLSTQGIISQAQVPVARKVLAAAASALAPGPAAARTAGGGATRGRRMALRAEVGRLPGHRVRRRGRRPRPVAKRQGARSLLPRAALPRGPLRPR